MVHYKKGLNHCTAMTTDELNRIYRENLRTLRTQSGLSQAALSEQAAITDKFYNDIETGRKWGSFETMVALANALGVEPHELLTPRMQAGSYDTKRTKQLMSSLRSHLGDLMDTLDAYLTR